MKTEGLSRPVSENSRFCLLGPLRSGRFRLRTLMSSCPSEARLLYGSRSSSRGFASSFLSTSPRMTCLPAARSFCRQGPLKGLSPSGHFPILTLWLPGVSAVPGATSHARRTNKKGAGYRSRSFCSFRPSGLVSISSGTGIPTGGSEPAG